MLLLDDASRSNDAEARLVFTQDVVPNPFVLRHALPRKYAEHGLLWWRAQLVAYIAQLAAPLRRAVDAHWRALSIDADAAAEDDDAAMLLDGDSLARLVWRADADCTAVHIRRGVLRARRRIAVFSRVAARQATRCVRTARWRACSSLSTRRGASGGGTCWWRATTPANSTPLSPRLPPQTAAGSKCVQLLNACARAH